MGKTTGRTFDLLTLGQHLITSANIICKLYHNIAISSICETICINIHPFSFTYATIDVTN